jgi:hypothetical protein
MATPTDDATLMTSDDNPTMDINSVVSAKFTVTRGFGGVVENAKVNVGKLYLRQIFAGSGTNQSDVIQPNAVTGLGKTAVNNWGIYDGPTSKAKLVAKGHGMHTFAGKWSNWFILVFAGDRYVDQ